MDQELEKKYPLDAKEYKVYEEVGEGVSATVYRALCIPLNEIVAVKVLDLEKCNNDLDGIRREVQTMTLTNHPNLLRAYCSFTTGHHLWIVMPYMSGGSCMHIMKFAYPEGFDEPVIATLLYEVLKALVYLHSHGHIHRDVKSGNILVDSKGAVKLADFGVSACMFDTGDRQRSRNTFVGTPCWMAPEVMQQLHGYDFKADIWSFGITALELAHGHAPFSKYPPMKVLLMTLQNAPPGLDYERDKRFSKSFKELVATCLVKDPKKRPSSEKLLKHHFFKRARATEYLGRTILDGLAPLGERFRTLKAKEAALLGQNKALYEDKEHLSQQEYIRGISAWNFNLEDLKRQAALIQDDDAMPNLENTDISIEQKSKHEGNFPSERQSPQRAKLVAHSQEDAFDDLHDLESSFASFPIKPLQALKDCFDVKEDELHATSPKWRADLSDTEEPIPEESSVGGAVHGLEESTMQLSSNATSSETSRNEGDHLWARSSLASDVRFENKRLSSAPGHQDLVKLIGEKDRDGCLSKCQHEHNQRKDIDNSSYGGDTLEGAVIQRKGRFKVTSADSPKASATSSCSSPYAGPANFTALNQAVAPLLPSLQSILQQNAMQREEIVNLIKFVEQMTGKDMESADSITTELLKSSPVTAKERELQSLVINLQQSVASAFEELQRQRLRNAQLERHIKTLANSKGE